MTKENVAFIKKIKKLAIIVTTLAPFNKNAFSGNHLIKLLVLFSISVKIMECIFIVQNNGYFLKSEK